MVPLKVADFATFVNSHKNCSTSVHSFTTIFYENEFQNPKNFHQAVRLSHKHILQLRFVLSNHSISDRLVENTSVAFKKINFHLLESRKTIFH
jgi:hypothetical protein